MDTIKRFAKWVDDQIDFRKVKGLAGILLETFDGPIFSIGFQSGYKLLSDDDKVRVDAILEDIMAGRYKELTDEAIDFLVVKVNTPLGDEIEEAVLKGLRGIVFDIIEIRRELAKSGEPGQGPIEPDPE